MLTGAIFSFLDFCNCKRGCPAFDYEDRLRLCSDFYNLSSKNEQKSYLMSLMLVKPISRRTVEDPAASRRQATVEYFLPDRNGFTLKVCKKTFMNTFAVSHGRLQTLMKRKKKVEKFVAR